MTQPIVYLHGKPKRKTSARVGWVVADNGCHVWQGAKNSHGYGIVWSGEVGASVLVHRLRYEMEVGPIPRGLDLDHFACDSGALGCCNPTHVRPVSRRENTLRSNSISAQSIVRSHCRKGHPYPEKVLSSGAVGVRRCRECVREFFVGFRARNKARLTLEKKIWSARNRPRINERRRARRALAAFTS